MQHLWRIGAVFSWREIREAACIPCSSEAVEPCSEPREVRRAGGTSLSVYSVGLQSLGLSLARRCHADTCMLAK